METKTVRIKIGCTITYHTGNDTAGWQRIESNDREWTTAKQLGAMPAGLKRINGYGLNLRTRASVQIHEVSR